MRPKLRWSAKLFDDVVHSMQVLAVAAPLAHDPKACLFDIDALDHSHVFDLAVEQIKDEVTGFCLVAIYSTVTVVGQDLQKR